MTILLAPSETKNENGGAVFDANNLSFANKLDRKDFIESYEKALQEGGNLAKLFSSKNDTQKHIDLYRMQTVLPAVERYTGVAYDYLDYPSLNDLQKNFIQNRTLIFSNLYGVLRPQDLIPYYKLKQGASLGGVSTHAYYKKRLDFLNGIDDEWLNLSANYYDKFFTPAQNHYNVKFLKEGKVVSHWAKAYRGLLLRECAVHQIDSIEKLLNHLFKKLRLVNIEESDVCSTLVYDVD
jgi:hypothetical protein